MYKKIIVLSAILWSTQFARAQVVNDSIKSDSNVPSLDESSFTFTESQLGEDDSDGKTSTIIGSANNIFTSNASMTFGAGSYRFRALDNKYNGVYINGVMVNDPERGYFRFTQIGGLNNISRNSDYVLPFEANSFCMPGAAGSVNYNFRPSQVAQGNKISASLANRTYTGRLMYTYGSGVNEKGWAFAGNITGRYAALKGFKNVEGAFYNSLSYYLGAEKIINPQNSVSLVSFGNPTERGSRGASTDEGYFLAGSNNYNPYLGYFNGHLRNSRVVRDYAPTTILTWDYNPFDNLKVTTSAFLVYSKYSSTKLSYGDGGTNPSPDYYKSMPSNFFDVYNSDNSDYRTESCLENWNTAYEYWSLNSNRYIDFNKLYFVNQTVSEYGLDAVYYQVQSHTDRISAGLSSSLRYNLTPNSVLSGGISYYRDKSNHYQTLYDLLGAKYFHNINNYAARNFPKNSVQVQYDYRYPNQELSEGDVFGYDYNIFTDRLYSWASYVVDKGLLHGFATAKLNYTDMFREGKMQNGLAPNSSYGPSDKARFLDGGIKGGVALNLGSGNAIEFGAGWEKNAPSANAAFAAPEINNDFARNLKCEQVISAELSYAYTSGRIKANVTGYYYNMSDVTKWTCFYYDDENSFTYVSMTGIEKAYYGAEIGLTVQLLSNLNFTALTSVSEAKYLSNADVMYMNSNNVTYSKDIVMSKGMREDGCPLSLYSAGFSYNFKGWFFELRGNYYDRIYLSFSPMARYTAYLSKHTTESASSYDVPAQAQGNGGFMLDGSVGKNFRLKHGSLYAGVMLTNILNNTNICTGGYEQSRSDYKTTGEERPYKFSENPKKYYAWGINGMLNVVYRF